MKKLYFLTALLVILNSCSSDADNDKIVKDPVSSADNTVHRTITQKNDSSEATIDTYTFNGNKVLSMKNDNTEFRYTYEGNRIAKKERFSKTIKGSMVRTEIYEYIYEKGKLKTRNILQGVNDNGEAYTIIKTEYIHNSDGTVSYINYYVHLLLNDTTKMQEGYLRYKDGNIIEKSETIESRTAVFKYEYDTKNNPAKNILGYDLLIDENNYAKNNIIKTNVKFLNTPYEEDLLRTYTYNENGYPIKFISTSPSQTYEVEYTY